MEKIDYWKYNLNVRNNENEIEKLPVESIKMKLIERLQMGLKLIKVDTSIHSWISKAYLKCGKQIVVLSCDESYPNKVNEIIFEEDELLFMINTLNDIE